MRFICLLSIQILLITLSTMYIVSNIEKHSIHPTYGNYKKLNTQGYRCQPWDDCK